MKITNTTGLPEPIVKAVMETEYVPSGADISVTSLISPIRQVALRAAHRDELVEDAADRIFALMGKIGHGVLEASGYDIFSEEQMFMKLGAFTLSGRMDGLYLEELEPDPAVIEPQSARSHQWGIDDYKFTSAYVVKTGRKPGERSRIDDWFLQLNLYRMLAEENGFDIGRLHLVMLLRDWSVLAAKRDPEFPQKQVVVISVPLMEMQQLKSWTQNRIEKHMEAQQGLDQYGQNHLPECDEEERWTKPAVYAVMKEGRKSALKLETSEVDAQQWMQANGKIGDKVSIVHRPGENVRCANYCEVSEWCEQYKAIQNKS